MDRFVSRKRKIAENDEREASSSNSNNENLPEIDERESSGSTSNIETHPVNRNVKENVAQSRKETQREFHAEWEELYFVSEHKNKAICLICRHNFTQNKKYTFERHFNGNHSEFNVKFSLSSKERAAKISQLKNELTSEQKFVKKFLSTNEIVTRASYEIAFEIAKQGKPYTDGEFHKQLMQTTIETLCEHWDEKQKTQLLEKIKLLPASHQTIGRRINDIAGEIEANLKCDLEQCEAFSLALDETTDIKDASQLLFWVRYIINDRIEENVLALVPLEEQTQGVDVFNAFLKVVERFSLDLKKLESVCTDGAPPMIGKDIGFVASLKKYVAENFGHQLLISYHCIIHQENLCAKDLEKNCNILKTVTKVYVAVICARHSLELIC